MSQTAPIPVTQVTTLDYEPFLVEGKPFGEVHWLRTTCGGEGQLFTGLWKHGAGSFDYTFPGDETFHVLEGTVTITIQGGSSVSLKPGDVVSFTKGQASTWTIHTPMKKFFVISG